MAGHVSEDQRKSIEATIGYDDASNTRATTAPNIMSKSVPNLRDASTSHGKRDEHLAPPIAGGFTRGELPKTLPIKVLNAGMLQETLLQTRERILNQETETAAAETAKRLKTASPPPRVKGGGANGQEDYEDDFEDEDNKRGKSNSKVPPSRGARGKTTTPSSDLEDEDDRVFKNFPYGDDAREKMSPGGKKDKKDDQALISDKSSFLPSKNGEFRREYSGDHPLAPGGKGHFKKEIAAGLKPAGTGGAKITIPGSVLTPTQASAKIEKLTLAAQVKVVDPQRQLEQLRREQNEALMRVLEEEKSAEEARERMSRAVLSEIEASRLELVFAEERRRASERIVRLTKEHEQRIKDAVLAQMALSKTKLVDVY